MFNFILTIIIPLMLAGLVFSITVLIIAAVKNWMLTTGTNISDEDIGDNYVGFITVLIFVFIIYYVL